MTCIEGQFDIVKLMKNSAIFSINVNAQNMNGMTRFVRILGTLECYTPSKEIYGATLV